MTPQQLLRTLEPLTYSDRIRKMIQMGQRSRQDSNVAKTLNQFAQGNFYERYLALQSCYSSRNLQMVRRSLVDPSRQIQAVALRLVALFGDGESVRSALETLPPKAKRTFLHRLLGRRRQQVVDEHLAQLAVSNPAQFLQLWHFGSAAQVSQQLDRLLQQGSAIGWGSLARRHPQLTAQALQRQVEGDALNFRLLPQVNAVLPYLARKCPSEAIALCRALLRTIPLVQLNLQPLILGYPNLAADLVLSVLSTSNQIPYSMQHSFNRVAHRLAIEPLSGLIERGYLLEPNSWIHRLPAAQRVQLYEWFRSRWCDAEGILSAAIVGGLPRSQREREAHHHLAMSTLLTRPSSRLQYAAFLPWTEAEALLEPFILNPEPDLRIQSLSHLIASIRFNRDRAAVMLHRVIQRRNEQDPVRLAMLTALANLPPGIWTLEQLPALRQIVEDALNAADLSFATAFATERLVLRILPFHPAWAAQQLALLIKKRGQLGFHALDRHLSNAQVRQIAPDLLPVLQAWKNRERAIHLVTIASCFGKRLPAFDGLVEILERVIQTIPDPGVISSGLTVLARYHRDRLHSLIPQLIRQDKSWITQPLVQAYLHRHRQDLLTPFLQRQPYPGRFSTGKTYTVLGVTDGFHRWTPTQQQHFADSLIAVSRDSWQNTGAIFQVMQQLGRLQTIAPTRLSQLAELQNTNLAVRDRALRILATRDSGDGVPVLLAALEDDRARIAIYALRTALLQMPAAQAIALLQSVPTDKVTVAKEVVRLLGEFPAEAAYQALLRWYVDRMLHRDVRVALLRALWGYLEREETWEILRQAAADPDAAIAKMVGRTPNDRLSDAAYLKLLMLLSSLLRHPDPLVRSDILNRCQSQLIDPQRHLQPALIAALTSALPDEAKAAAAALIKLYSGSDPAGVATVVQQVLRDRQVLLLLVEALTEMAKWQRSQVLATTQQVLEVLSSDPILSWLRMKLAVVALAHPQLTDFLIEHIPTLMPDQLWIAENGIKEQLYNQHDSELATLETTLAVQADDRLRSLAVTALEAQATTEGWTAERRSRLAQYQSDPSVQVAAKAQFIFPPEAVSPGE